MRVPSLSDLYENVENRESDFMQEMLSDIDEIQDLKEQFEEMELQILKSKELDWDKEQSLKNSIEESKEEPRSETICFAICLNAESNCPAIIL